MEATTTSSTEPLVLSKALLYAYSFSCVDDELMSFQSYLRWMCVDWFGIRLAMVL
ncbi:hypothetical protein GW17_00059694 [Ensete ventricosum]|nr:hypothetical protein GW17_00059694 [Ensete ventricosum]